MQLYNKIKATAGSQNFFVSLISLLLLTFELNGLSTGADPENIFDAITSGDAGRILSILLINFLNPILKLVQKQETWSWDFLKSVNFWTQAVTTILAAITIAGVAFPEGAAANLVEAIFGGTFQTIAVAVVVNILNPLYHFFFDRDEPGSIPGEREQAPTKPIYS